MAEREPSSAGESITIQRITPYGSEAQLHVSSPAFASGGYIPDRYSAYGDGWSPPLQWAAVPGAAAFVLIVEDPDAPREEPFLHWAIWNIPGDATSLPERLPDDRTLDVPQGARQGANDHGGYGWFGPRPPDGHPPHHYHFQLFALGAPLDLPPGAALHELVDALKGGVVAKGELIGLYQRRVQ